MTNPLGFDALKGILHRRIAQLPDHRHKGPNTRYAIQEAAFGAFGIFFTQSPSFLEYQRRLQHTKGDNNAHTLLGVEQIPCDNQVRKLLDPLAPSHLDAVFVEVFEGLEQVSSQKFGETDSDSQDAPKRICFAFSLRSSAREALCLAPDTLSLMYAETLTPSFLAVSTIVIPVSQAWTPSAVRGPKLTALFRPRARAPHSAALLCNGTSG